MTDPCPYRFKRWLRTSELREYMGGISFRKLRKMQREAGFPMYVDIGGIHLYDKTEVDDWMDYQRGPGGAND